MAIWNSQNLGGQRAAGANIREDLSNMISNIDRDETPFLSSIGTNKATGPLHEWLTDTYADPTSNQQAEGFTFDSGRANSRQSARSRVDNRTQVFGKDILASGSTISSDVAGVANEFAYQLKKAGVEIRRDIEFQHLRWHESGNESTVVKRAAGNNGSGDAQTSNGRLGSVFSYAANWYNATSAGVLRQIAGSTAARAQTGGDNFFASDVTGATTDGSQTVNFAAAPTRVDVARGHFEGLVEQMFLDGGKPSMAMIPARLKTSVSAAMISGQGDVGAQRRADDMSKKLNLAVTGVMTDFGFDIALVPNYIMNATNAGSDNAIVLYDPKMLKRSILTPLATEEDRVARYGRAAIMYCEETLEVMNPRSVGVIVGVQ